MLHREIGNTQNWKEPHQAEIDINLEGQLIAEKNMIRILGMWLQSSGKCSHTISLLQKSTDQVSRMITRVSNRRHGMKEADTIKLVKGLLVSRVTYSLPYHLMNKLEREQAETILRKAYKTALHLPRNTSNDKLLQLGIHNTFSELAEAQLNTQIARLWQSATGRMLLKRLGYDTKGAIDREADIPDNVRQTLRISPIPRNMDPNLHAARRQARADYVEGHLATQENTVYTDAGLYPWDKHTRTHRVATAVVDYMGETISCATIRNCTVAEGEEVAIALAATEGYRSNRSLTILTDSKAACRHYMQGRVCKEALRILLGAGTLGNKVKHKLFWIPAHTGIEGNVRADSLVREITYRAGQIEPLENPTTVEPTCAEILNYHRGRESNILRHTHYLHNRKQPTGEGYKPELSIIYTY